MCVIIKRDPGIEIPSEKIWSACEVNPDGFGLSVIDRGKIETIKIYNPGGNKAEEVLRRLEEAKDHKIFLHLRYTTAGKNSTDNCHPFTSFEDGPYKIEFMHNGTLTSFKENGDTSDSHNFNEQIIKPTINAFYSLDGENVLLNETLSKIFKEFKGGSVFTFFDSNGNDLLLENTSCKDHGGWWSSNEYSFNRKHREPTKNTYWTNYKSNLKKQEEKNNNNTFGGGSSEVASLPKPSIPAKERAEQAKKTKDLRSVNPAPLVTQARATGFAISQAKKDGIINRYHTPPNKRVTFKELAEINDLKDILVMSEEELYDLCDEQPMVATTLLMDLIYELWKKQKEGN